MDIEPPSALAAKQCDFVVRWLPLGYLTPFAVGIALLRRRAGPRPSSGYPSERSSCRALTGSRGTGD
jgi:hypothetical protein